MAAMMTDAILQTLTPQVVNATCNAAGKLLKVTELQQKLSNTGRPVNFPLIGPAV
jgi:hypothetical protein